MRRVLECVLLMTGDSSRVSTSIFSISKASKVGLQLLNRKCKGLDDNQPSETDNMYLDFCHIVKINRNEQ